ncbi:PHP domain-containing protein [Gilvimarinus sp. DA14]|uniref:PHP domain-containing protein n=1 Tax=Gilvimarinus sp. DA14 TaxID=2956798 RepID=UPI0020B8927E|nr:PHP domain-containing protein [Gilvimarinus sp. DA14]UTF60966.1 PHP domain-containing protein [Gilvimarinus sp. DA14]
MNQLRVDLHMHSHCSDGALSPSELMQRASEKGVELIALTDHDTLAGLTEARGEADKLNMAFVSGIELSSRWGKIGVHIVGLGFESTHPAMAELVRKQGERRRCRNQKIGAKLAKIGVQDAYRRARELAGAEPGRPHFAELLVQDGRVPDVSRAFKKYLGSGKSCDIKLLWPPMVEVVDAINGAGGVAVLAHPAKYGLTRTKLRALVADFSAAGGSAMELVSGMQPSGVAENLAAIAAEFGLEASLGSDFHRPGAAWQELGCATHLPEGARAVWHRWQ